MVLLLWRRICTIVTSVHHDSTRTTFISNNSTIWQLYNRKYRWLHSLLLHPSGYSIWGSESYHCLKYTNMDAPMYWGATPFRYLKTITVFLYLCTCVSTTQLNNRKYRWLHSLLLHPSGYSIWGSESYLWSIIRQTSQYVIHIYKKQAGYLNDEIIYNLFIYTQYS